MTVLARDPFGRRELVQLPDGSVAVRHKGRLGPPMRPDQAARFIQGWMPVVAEGPNPGVLAQPAPDLGPPSAPGQPAPPPAPPAPEALYRSAEGARATAGHARVGRPVGKGDPASAHSMECRLANLEKGGAYCCVMDSPEKCFSTPQGLGGHAAQTGHSPHGAVQYGRQHIPESPAEPAQTTQSTFFASFRQALNFDEVAAKYANYLPDLHHVVEVYRKAAAQLDKGEQGYSTLDNTATAEDSSIWRGVLSEWAGQPDRYGTLALWIWAALKYDNANFPRKLQADISDESVLTELASEVPEWRRLSPEVAEAFERGSKASQVLARRMDPTYDSETDTVVMYRGIKDRDEKIGTALDSGQDFQVEATHRTLESWSADPSVAESFGPIVIRARVPVSSIVASFMSTNNLLDGEREYIVATPGGKAVYERGNFIPWEENVEWESLPTKTAYEWNQYVQRVLDLDNSPTYWRGKLEEPRKRLQALSDALAQTQTYIERTKRGEMHYGSGVEPTAMLAAFEVQLAGMVSSKRDLEAHVAKIEAKLQELEARQQSAA